MGIKRNQMGLIQTALIKQNDYHCKNIHPDIYVKARNSILKDGQLKAVVVRQTDEGYEIVKGNNLFQLLKEEGAEDVCCFNVGDISLDEAKLMYIQLSSELEINYVKIAQIISDIFSKFNIYDIEKVAPYSIAEISELKKLLEFNWEKYKQSEPDVEQGSLF